MSFARRRRALPLDDGNDLARALTAARLRQAGTRTAQIHAHAGHDHSIRAHADPLIEIFAPEGNRARVVTQFSVDAQTTVTTRQSP